MDGKLTRGLFVAAGLGVTGLAGCASQAPTDNIAALSKLLDKRSTTHITVDLDQPARCSGPATISDPNSGQKAVILGVTDPLNRQSIFGSVGQNGNQQVVRSVKVTEQSSPYQSPSYTIQVNSVNDAGAAGILANIAKEAIDACSSQITNIYRKQQTDPSVISPGLPITPPRGQQYQASYAPGALTPGVIAPPTPVNVMYGSAPAPAQANP